MNDIIVRNCTVCDKPIPARVYQDRDVRVCSPGCAGTLFKREHPKWSENIEPPPSGEPTP